MQQRYWNMLVHLRYGIEYYGEHLRFCVSFDRYFKMIVAVFTASSVASWGIWNSYTTIWAVIVALGQLAVVINEFLPYKNRIIQIQGLKAILNRLFDQAENQWLDVSKGSLTEDQINDLTTEFRQKWNQAEEKFIKDDYLSEPKWLTKRAQKRMLRYFEFYYGGKIDETKHT